MVLILGAAAAATVGCGEDDAGPVTADRSVRVIERDGRALPHTQDLRRDRINVDVRDEYVLRASVG